MLNKKKTNLKISTNYIDDSYIIKMSEAINLISEKYLSQVKSPTSYQAKISVKNKKKEDNKKKKRLLYEKTMSYKISENSFERSNIMFEFKKKLVSGEVDSPSCYKWTK